MAGAVKIISPDGKSEKLWPAEHVSEMTEQGWTLASGQKVGVQTEEGRLYIPAEEAAGELGSDSRYGASGAVPAELAIQDYEAKLQEDKYGDRTGEALLAGAASGLTFGLSNALLPALDIVDKETLAGLKEENQGAYLTGEIGSIVGGGLAGAAKGAVGRLAARTPVGKVSQLASRYGEKGTRQYLAGQAAEGMLQGVGMSVSEVALSDTPWASETAARELLQGGLMGGALGLGGAAALKGAGAVARKVRTPKAPDILDITTPNGKTYLDNVASSVQKNLDIGDDVFVKTDYRAQRAITETEALEIDNLHSSMLNRVEETAESLNNKYSQIAGQRFSIPARPNGVPPTRPDRILELVPDPPYNGKAINEIANPVPPEAIPKPRPPVRPERPDMPLVHRDIADASDLAARQGAIQSAYDAEMKSYREAMKSYKKDMTQWSRDTTKLQKQYSADLKKANAARAKQWSESEKAFKAHGKKIKAIEARNARAIKTYDAESKAYEKELAKFDRDSAKEMAAYESSVSRIEDAIAAKNADMADIGRSLGRLEEMKVRFSGKDKLAALADEGDMFVSGVGISSIEREVRSAMKRLGAGDFDVSDFSSIVKKGAEVSDRIRKRLDAPIPRGIDAARKAFQEADQAAKKMFGTPTGMSMSKVVGGSPEEVVEAFNVLQRRAVAAEELAIVSGDKKLLTSLREQYRATSEELIQAMPRETAEAMSKTDIAMTLGSLGLPMLSDGPYDNVAGMAVMFSILKRGKGINQLAKAVKGGGRVSSSLPGQMGQAASGAAARGAYKILGRGMDAMATPGGIFRVAGKAQSEMRQAIGMLGKKAVKGSLAGGGGAATILRGMKIGEDIEKKSKEDDDLYALFKQKSEALREIAHNQQALEMALWEDTKELRGANPLLGDGAEVTAGRGISHLQQTMPRDPGGYDSFAGSSWRPDDFAIHEWANRVKAVMDPLSVVRGVKDGTITPEGAETLRAVYPETFAKVQMEIAANRDEIAKNLTYDEENRLSILMGVPVNAQTQPDYISFIAQSYAQRQQQQTQGMQRVDSDALMQGTPTRAQQLLNKDR